jgi:hypothetical protein
MPIDNTNAQDESQKPKILKIFIETLYGDLIDVRLIDTIESEDSTYLTTGNPCYKVVINKTEENDSVDYKNKIWTFNTPQERDYFKQDLNRKIKSLPNFMVL